MRVFAASAAAVLLSLAACKPIERAHTYDYAYPRPKRDFTLRWIGTPSGVAVWITTSDDGEANGRYEGVSLLVDPGSPKDVEAVVLPYLARNGLRSGMPLPYVVLTSNDAQAVAGANRAAKEFAGTQVVAPGRAGKTGSTEMLKIAPEVSVRVLRPEGTHAPGAQALSVRFIDVQFLLLPGHADGIAEALAEEIGERFEKEGLTTTLVYAAGGRGIEKEALEHLHPEVVVGETGAATVHLAAPRAGEVLELGTNGSEMRSPGPRTRSRYGHWIDCSGAETACGADLPVHGAGPVLVPLRLSGQDEGLFLVDTRAPFSYLVRPRFEKIPGWEAASGAGHSHAGGAIGLEIPAFTIAGGGRTAVLHRWHVLPIEPFQIEGKEVAGVIGLDLLQSFRLELRPREKVLSWTPNFDAPRERLAPAETKTEGAVSRWDVPMDKSPAGPLILATMDGEPKSLIVDLASEETRVYVRPEAWATKVVQSAPRTLWTFDVPDEIDEAAWKKVELKAGPFPVKELNLFGAKFRDQSAVAVDRPLDADVLGLDFLRTFDRVSLDFRRRSILLERSSG